MATARIQELAPARTIPFPNGRRKGGGERRLLQFERLFHTAEILRGRRHPATATDVNVELADRMEAACYRTTHRDLQVLVAIGVVEQLEGRADDHKSHMFRWASSQGFLATPGEAMKLVTIYASSGSPIGRAPLHFLQRWEQA